MSSVVECFVSSFPLTFIIVHVSLFVAVVPITVDHGGDGGGSSGGGGGAAAAARETLH